MQRITTYPAVRAILLWSVSFMILMGFFLRGARKNYLEIFPHELLLPTLMNGATAVIAVLALFWLPWLKNFTAKLVAVTVLSLLLLAYDDNLQGMADLIFALAPGLTSSDPLVFVSLIYFGILVIITVFVGRKSTQLLTRFTRLKDRDVQLGIFALVGYLFLVPAASFAQIMPAILAQSQTLPTALEPPAASPTVQVQEKPDIFYFVFDRYTNGEVLQKQFNFNNLPFTQSLQKQGFHVNSNAYSNYPYTAMSVASTINAQYTNGIVAPFKDAGIQNRTLYHNLTQQSEVAKALKQQGYQYYSLGSWYGATNKAPLADRDYARQHVVTAFGVEKRLRGIEATEFRKSIFYRFFQTPIKGWPLHVEESDHIGDIRTQLQALEHLTTKESPGGRFIFAHILVPHDPFIFNADCSMALNTDTNSLGKPIKQKYTDQISCVNTYITDIIDNIQRQSGGKAVVILNADEGPYPQKMGDSFLTPAASASIVPEGENMIGWTDDYFKMKFGILQAVHIPRATPQDLQQLSSVNAFRIVLNRYFGYKLDYLPNCHFGTINGIGKEFNYVDVSGRFTDTPDERCQEYASVPGK